MRQQLDHLQLETIDVVATCIREVMHEINGEFIYSFHLAFLHLIYSVIPNNTKVKMYPYSL